jgi:uncharacterized protein (TIGR02145 family)
MLVYYRRIAPICLLVWSTGTLAAENFSEDAAGLREQALQPPQVFINPGESLYSSSRRMFQGIPGIERAASGRLWVSRFSGSTGEGASSNYGLLITSGDDGRTWSDLKVVVDVPGSQVRICDPCLWIDPLGRLWFFWCQAYSPWVHCGFWAMVTENPGEANPKWSKPRRLCEGVMLNKPTVLASGDWLFPVNVKKDLSEYQWRAGEEPPTNIVVMATGDQGATFARRGTAPVAPEDKRHTFSEPMIVELSNGELWMPVRASYGLGETRSSDRGKTWSPIRPAAIKHAGSRFFVRKLQSGNLLLVKHGPIDQRTHRELLTAYISTDDAATWSDGLMLDERYHLSYPDGTQAPDGTIYVVYDHGRYPGTAREILMAVFTEADVVAGIPSEKTRLKALVNQAVEPGCDQQDGHVKAREGVPSETVRIGDQEWMTTNLSVSRFRNGDPIPEAKTAEEWEQAGKQQRPAWCYFENDPENGKLYGKLYNWYAVIDPRGLAPEGWRIPNNNDWSELADRYGGIRKAGSMLKSAAGWGATGNGTNESGFAGLPGGIRTDRGDFVDGGVYGYWWSTTELNGSYAFYRYLYCRSGKLFSYVNYFKSSGFSVRCLRD